MARLGEVRKVYSITTLFTDHKIAEYDAVSESVGPDGKPNWETVRIWVSHPDTPTEGHFAFLHKEDFFFNREEAVTFAVRALRAHAVYVGSLFARLQADQAWADDFRQKTTEYVSRELTPTKKPKR